MLPLDEFFAGEPLSRRIFETVRRAVESIGPVNVRISRSQIVFHRRHTVALVWMPGQYLRRKVAPLVLTFSFHQRDPSPRWKEIVVPAPGRFTHHLELYEPADVDDEVLGWLRDAWTAAA